MQQKTSRENLINLRKGWIAAGHKDIPDPYCSCGLDETGKEECPIHPKKKEITWGEALEATLSIGNE